MADDMAAAPGENPYLSTRPVPTRQSERTDDDGIGAPKATAPGENSYLFKISLSPAKSKMTDDDGIEAPMATAICENPYLLTRPLPTTQSGSTSGDGTQPVQWTAPGENLSLSTLPLTSTEAAWQSSQTAWQSIKRGEQTTKLAKTSALALASSEAARSSDVSRQLTKRRKQTAKIAQSSTQALTSSEAAWRSSKIDRQLTKQGEQTAEIEQTSSLGLASSEAAWESSKIAWQSIEGKERTAEIVRTQKQIATSGTKAGHPDFGTTLIGQPGPKVKRPIVRIQHQNGLPLPQRNRAIPATEPGVFSHDEIPQTCPDETVRPQTLRLVCKRPDAATKNHSSRPSTSQRESPSSSHQGQPLYPFQDSKIQKIGDQYYSKLIYGGWRVLNARDAAIEIQKEDWARRARKRTLEGKVKEAAESEREEESNRGGSGSQSPSLQPSFTRPPTSDGITSINPPGKRRRHTDYQGLISCRPSDKLWKSWENKHLLRSYAAGSSFAQISASREFSNGLVIRSEKECHERYKFLQEWQLFQDEELLRVGGTEGNEDFAQICSVNFSRGLVKRSAEQCKERFEFLRKSKFEGF